MGNITDLEHQMHQLLQEAERRGYDRGYAEGVSDAKSKILAAIEGGGPAENALPSRQDVGHSEEAARKNEGGRDKQRQRAPRGLPRALATRALSNSPHGATPQQIVEAAGTDFERMIKVSSIRSELRKGQIDGRYIEIDGLWHLAVNIEAEDKDLDVDASASGDNNNGGKSNAAALD